MCAIYEYRSDKVKSVQFSMTSSEEQATSTQKKLDLRGVLIYMRRNWYERKIYDTSPLNLKIRDVKQL